MADLDNPAGRLHDLLAAVKGTDGGQAAGVVWGSILGANYPNELAVLLARLAVVVGLPEKARYQLRALGEGEGGGEDDELYFEPLNSAEAAFASLHLNTPIREFQNLVTDNTLFGLRACSRLLHNSGLRRTLPNADALETLQRSTHELLGEVLQADGLAEDLRAFLIEHLNDMSEVLQQYRISGREVLEGAVDRTVGSLVRRPDLRPELRKAPLGKRFLELMKNVIVVLTVVNSSFEAIDSAFPQLMPAPPSVVQPVSATSDPTAPPPDPAP